MVKDLQEKETEPDLLSLFKKKMLINQICTKSKKELEEGTILPLIFGFMNKFIHNIFFRIVYLEMYVLTVKLAPR